MIALHSRSNQADHSHLMLKKLWTKYTGNLSLLHWPNSVFLTNFWSRLDFFIYLQDLGCWLMAYFLDHFLLREVLDQVALLLPLFNLCLESLVCGNRKNNNSHSFMCNSFKFKIMQIIFYYYCRTSVFHSCINKNDSYLWIFD